MRKKKSESWSMWEVGEREERRGRGDDGENVVGWCGLAVARDVKCATDKEVAAARFCQKRYC